MSIVEKINGISNFFPNKNNHICLVYETDSKKFINNEPHTGQITGKRITIEYFNPASIVSMYVRMNLIGVVIPDDLFEIFVELLPNERILNVLDILPLDKLYNLKEKNYKENILNKIDEIIEKKTEKKTKKNK